MTDITFEDYILAGVHKSVRGDSSAKDWALAGTKVLKNLRALGDRRSECIRKFAASVQFSGEEEAFIEFIIGYVLTVGVSLNMESGLFIPMPAGPSNTTTDPAIMAFLEKQRSPIASLLEQVQALTSAPQRPKTEIPKLSLSALHNLYVSYNRPKWATKVLWLLGAVIMRMPVPLKDMQMSEKLGDEQQLAIPLQFTEEQKSNDTVWTDIPWMELTGS